MRDTCSSVHNARDLQVIYISIVQVDILKIFGLGVLEVEFGHPVGTFVTWDIGISALGVEEALAGDCCSKATGAHDGMGMGRPPAGADNGVDASFHERPLAMESENSKRAGFLGSKSRAPKGGHGGQGCKNVAHRACNLVRKEKSI